MTEGCHSDEELVRKYRSEAPAGDREALLNELFLRYYDRVALWCARLTGDRDSAPDMTQEIFMKAYRHLRSYQEQAKFSTWLFSITRNHCVSAIRARHLRPALDGQELLPAIADGQPGPEGIVERAESSRILRGLIESSLDEREKQVMLLYYGEELPLDAITRRMALVNASGAKAYIVSARRKLERAARRIGTRLPRAFQAA